MKCFKWKQRQIKAKAELEAAERAARYKAFWEAVEKPRLILENPDTFVTPIDYDELPV